MFISHGNRTMEGNLTSHREYDLFVHMFSKVGSKTLAEYLQISS